MDCGVLLNERRGDKPVDWETFADIGDNERPVRYGEVPYIKLVTDTRIPIGIVPEVFSGYNGHGIQPYAALLILFHSWIIYITTTYTLEHLDSSECEVDD